MPGLSKHFINCLFLLHYALLCSTGIPRAATLHKTCKTSKVMKKKKWGEKEKGKKGKKEKGKEEKNEKK
jgi:hypothetical protein